MNTSPLRSESEISTGLGSQKLTRALKKSYQEVTS